MNYSPFAALESWSAELQSRANRVRSLIGPAHWLTDGKHKERILSEFLLRHLPKSLCISTGFICPPTPIPNPSREIDILIADPEMSPPWFNEGDVVIVPPRSLIAQIQVKTTLGPTELSDIISSLANTYRISVPYVRSKQIWSGGFFYDPGRYDTLASAAKLIEKCLVEETSNLNGSVKSPHYLPKCIVVLGHYVILIHTDPSNTQSCEAIVRIFEDKGLGASIMLTSLSSHILQVRKSDSNTNLEDLLARAMPAQMHEFSVKCSSNQS